MEVTRQALIDATRDPDFWRCYAFDRDDEFDFVEVGERLARRLNDVDEWNDEDDDDLSSARFVLPARRGWWLGLELNFELALHVLYLQRYEDEDDEPDDDEDDDLDYDDYAVPDVSVELGHWDQARWHPFCLRWSELEAVVAQMRDRSLPPELGMLLLARWVGHGSDEAGLLDDRRKVVAGAFERLGLFHGDDAARMAAQLMRAVPEDDYAWRWDAERGWQLGGEYAGYSIRNDCHSRFPFAEFTEFRRQLGVSDGPDGRS